MFDKLSGRRDKSSEDLSYYKDEPGGSSNKVASALFGLFALFVTLLIASAVFFGGRAVYRALTDDTGNEVSTPATEEQNEGTQQEGEGNKEDQQANEQNEQTEGNGSPDSSSETNGGSTPTTGDTPESTPQTGDTPSGQALPRTGDPGL